MVIYLSYLLQIIYLHYLAFLSFLLRSTVNSTAISHLQCQDGTVSHVSNFLEWQTTYLGGVLTIKYKKTEDSKKFIFVP